jgi:hypothetical protein
VVHLLRLLLQQWRRDALLLHWPAALQSSSQKRSRRGAEPPPSQRTQERTLGAARRANG